MLSPSSSITAEQGVVADPDARLIELDAEFDRVIVDSKWRVDSDDTAKLNEVFRGSTAELGAVRTEMACISAATLAGLLAKAHAMVRFPVPQSGPDGSPCVGYIDPDFCMDSPIARSIMRDLVRMATAPAAAGRV